MQQSKDCGHNGAIFKWWTSIEIAIKSEYLLQYCSSSDGTMLCPERTNQQNSTKRPRTYPVPGMCCCCTAAVDYLLGSITYVYILVYSVCSHRGFVKVFPTELYEVKDRSIAQPRVILVTLFPPLNGGIFGASEPYTSARWPTRFVSLPGEPGRRVVFRDVPASASASNKETLEVRFEPVIWTTSNVKVLPTEL